MLECVFCNINEINLKEVNPLFYKNDLFVYNMNLLFSTGEKMYIDSMRLVELFIDNNTNGQNVVFRFINMNKFCGRNYKKFSDSYTEFKFNRLNSILTISYYAYFITGDSESKEIIDCRDVNIRNCANMGRFLYFLYTKFKNMNNISPIGKM
jgi:hypothetical protein